MLKVKNFFAFSILVLYPFASAICEKQPVSSVYQWTDKNGVVHFSSSKPHPDAKPADLPPLLREKAPIHLNIKATCSDHGGIDCKGGADKDGSVICMDGFNNSVERFQLRCAAAKISVSDIKHNNKDNSVSVWIRNEKDTVAKNVMVKVVKPDNSSLNAVGPDTIDAMGLAEYKLSKIENSSTIKPENVETKCSNCG